MSDKIYELKSEAEDKIYGILRELEKSTGLYVSDITFEHRDLGTVELTMENYFNYSELNIKLSTL